MKFKKLLILVSICTFACLSRVAQAGVIRYAGKQIAEGSEGATRAAAASSAAVAGGTASAGHTVVNAAKNGLTGAEGGVAAAVGGAGAAGETASHAVAGAATRTGSVLKSAPRTLACGTKATARKVRRVVW